MIANVILSGDNAVVIAMAGPQSHRKAPSGGDHLRLAAGRHHPADRLPAGLLGCVARCALPSKLVGGFPLLLWIGPSSLVGRRGRGGDVKAHEQLWPAIWSIRLRQHGHEPSTMPSAIHPPPPTATSS